MLKAVCFTILIVCHESRRPEHMGTSRLARFTRLYVINGQYVHAVCVYKVHDVVSYL